MKLCPLIRNLLFLPLGILLVSSVAEASIIEKTLAVWGHEISYELVTLQNPKLSYDGATFKLGSSKKEKHRIVLNTVFFKKEALEIWNDFESSPTPSSETSPNLMMFLNDLVALDEQIKRSGPLTLEQKSSFVLHLKELKKQLQYAAWFDIYKNTLKTNKSAERAKNQFVRLFTNSRKQTIEYHEASHLLDEIQRSTPFNEETDGNETEVKAFLAELAHGSNPQDSFWQMVAGVLDEIEKGRSVDYSIQKMRTVLDASQTMPWIVKGEMLCFLCFLSKQEAREMALSLYNGFLAKNEWARNLQS